MTGVVPVLHGPASGWGAGRRPLTGHGIVRLLEESRAGVARVEVADLAGEVRAGALVVDTRPVEQRARDGLLPGALVIDRNVLEWRLDPSSPDRVPQAPRAGQRVVVVCNEGYSSSLAAATLRRVGLPGATDLVGGFQAWLAAGHVPAPWRPAQGSQGR
jgi:rhodanese-related sulfurtransferase